MKKVQLSQDNRLDVYVSLCKEHRLPYDIKRAKKWLSSCSLEDEALIDRMQKIIPLYRKVAPQLGYSMKFVDLSILTDPSIWTYVSEEDETGESVEDKKPRKVIRIQYDPTLLGWALASVSAGDIDEILKLVAERGEVVLGTVLRAYEMLGRIPDGRIRQIVHHYQQEDRTGGSNSV